MNAHDVRHLCICSLCGNLGDGRDMISMTNCRTHGRCFIERHGLPALLELPREQLENLTLGDIGVDAMKAILDARVK